MAVWGAGPIALLAVRLARLKGAGRITVLARSHSGARIELASRFGADWIVCTDLSDPREAFRDCPADRILVTTPPPTLRDAVDIASFGAVISHIGFGSAPGGSLCTLDIDRMHFRRLQLRFSFAAPALFFPLCIDMIRNGLVDVKPLISRRVSLEELGDALATCRTDKEGTVKVMMVR